MTDRFRLLTLRWPIAVVAALVLLLAGAAIGVMIRRSPARDAPAPGAAMAPAAAHATPGSPISSGPLPEPAVTLTPEMVKRAGIEVTPAVVTTAAGVIRIPGVVQPNAYREVAVTSLVDGRITRVTAELGHRVTQGQTLAEVYSPQFAELQTTFLAMRADLEAAHERLARTERLVEIGAASRQELESVRAEHTHHEAALEAARARLMLLGLSHERLDRLSSSATTATVAVEAPISGVVTKRDANVGLNVQTAMPLFTVVDLSTVWIVGDLYESSFSVVRVGSVATVTTDAYPGLTFTGRVSYIDPQVKEETRTAKLRVEVPNRREQLRLGMYVNVSVGGAATRKLVAVPRSAVQTVGDRQVVYLVDPQQDGRFREREVQLGEVSGGMVAVISGVAEGDKVVTSGAFFVRAELERASPHSHSSAPVAGADRSGAAGQRTKETVASAARVSAIS